MLAAVCAAVRVRSRKTHGILERRSCICRYRNTLFSAEYKRQVIADRRAGMEALVVWK